MSSRRPTTDRPSLARADRRERERFRAMAVKAQGCAATADAFAFAYQSLPLRDRIRMAHAVARDLSSSGDEPGPALAILLAIEEDPQAHGELIALLAAHIGDSPATEAEASFFVEAPGAAPAVLIGMPSGTEWLGLFVGGEEAPAVEISSAPTYEDLEAQTSARLGASPERISPYEAVEAAAPRLLQHRRVRGSLPPEARCFAELFSI